MGQTARQTLKGLKFHHFPGLEQVPLPPLSALGNGKLVKSFYYLGNKGPNGYSPHFIHKSSSIKQSLEEENGPDV